MSPLKIAHLVIDRTQLVNFFGLRPCRRGVKQVRRGGCVQSVHPDPSNDCGPPRWPWRQFPRRSGRAADDSGNLVSYRRDPAVPLEVYASALSVSVARIASLVAAVVILATYSALVRGPDRAVLDVHPIRARLLVTAIGRMTLRSQLYVVALAGVRWCRLADRGLPVYVVVVGDRCVSCAGRRLQFTWAACGPPTAPGWPPCWMHWGATIHPCRLR